MDLISGLLCQLAFQGDVVCFCLFRFISFFYPFVNRGLFPRYVRMSQLFFGLCGLDSACRARWDSLLTSRDTFHQTLTRLGQRKQSLEDIVLIEKITGFEIVTIIPPRDGVMEEKEAEEAEEAEETMERTPSFLVDGKHKIGLRLDIEEIQRTFDQRHSSDADCDDAASDSHHHRRT
jgi:hypothetical protein